MGYRTYYLIPIAKGLKETIKYCENKLIEYQKAYEWWGNDENNVFYDELNSIKNGNFNKNDITLLGNIQIVNNEIGVYVESKNFSIDKPRISIYPNIVVTSTEQMFNLIKNGIVDKNNKHFRFYGYDKFAKTNIINFFKNHPDGIITFE